MRGGGNALPHRFDEAFPLLGTRASRSPAAPLIPGLYTRLVLYPLQVGGRTTSDRCGDHLRLVVGVQLDDPRGKHVHESDPRLELHAPLLSSLDLIVPPVGGGHRAVDLGACGQSLTHDLRDEVVRGTALIERDHDLTAPLRLLGHGPYPTADVIRAHRAEG
jgi:hypothetical protein